MNDLTSPVTMTTDACHGDAAKAPDTPGSYAAAVFVPEADEGWRQRMEAACSRRVRTWSQPPFVQSR